MLFDPVHKECKFYTCIPTVVLSIVYWDDWRQTVVVLGECLLVWMLLTLTFNTFIHTIVVLLLSFLIVSLGYIVINVAIDSFYNKEIKNPFRYLQQ